MKIIETTLRSKKTSELTLTSFVKIIVRNCLVSEPQEIFWYLALLLNMLKRNENLEYYTKSDREMLEVFRLGEDLYKCNANNSRAFELPTIERHYLKEVTSMAKGLRTSLRESDY